jgi:hypothetical protein
MIGSTGLWSFVQWLITRKSADNDLLLGLAHDRILSLCSEYIKRGDITRSEYENLSKYLYKPYIARGGNGVVKHMMEQVDRLPVREG